VAADAALLSIEDVSVNYLADHGSHRALERVTLRLTKGRAIGVAGESGSGKSTLALAIMGLLPRDTKVDGHIYWNGRDLVGASNREIRAIRGRHIAIVFQENITALNPVIRVGAQMRRAIKAHNRLTRSEVTARCTNALNRVQLTDHDRILKSFPSQLSGGMCQRVLIAMALASGAGVLIADEPTTALDVSVQAEILTLLRTLMTETDLGMIIISHDLGVLDEVADEIVVMHEGAIVESGATQRVLSNPRHPYTQQLLSSLKRIAPSDARRIGDDRVGSSRRAERSSPSVKEASACDAN